MGIDRPCRECPWRWDVPTGHFPPERFVALARTAYDMAQVQFACHMSPDGEEFACAGFLLRGADHNLAVRINRSRGESQPPGSSLPLYSNYREMAVANGVDPDDPVLLPCRGGGEEL